MLGEYAVQADIDQKHRLVWRQRLRTLGYDRGAKGGIGACDTGKFDQQACAVQLAEIYDLLVVLSPFLDAGNHFRQLRQAVLIAAMPRVSRRKHSLRTRLSIGQGQGDKFML